MGLRAIDAQVQSECTWLVVRDSCAKNAIQYREEVRCGRWLCLRQHEASRLPEASRRHDHMMYHHVLRLRG